MILRFPHKAGSVASRIAALRLRHRKIDERVSWEHGRPQPDIVVLKTLKRERLRLKDELHRYEGLLQSLTHGRPAT